MGLDMFVYKRKTAPAYPVDFESLETDEEVFYWRKHPNLHGWFSQLYTLKGGGDPDFNCNNVLIDAGDLDDLEDAIKDNDLPHTTGFFFGESSPEDKEDDLQFIELARQAIADGYYLYYTSCW